VNLRHSKLSIHDSTDIQEDLRLLFLESNCSNNQSNNQTYHRQSSLSLMIRNPTTTVHYFWRKFDDKFMRPIFGGRGFVPVVHGSPPAEEDISWNASKYYLLWVMIFESAYYWNFSRVYYSLKAIVLLTKTSWYFCIYNSKMNIYI
jgi:hypothetical protein